MTNNICRAGQSHQKMNIRNPSEVQLAYLLAPVACLLAGISQLWTMRKN